MRKACGNHDLVALAQEGGEEEMFVRHKINTLTVSLSTHKYTPNRWHTMKRETTKVKKIRIFVVMLMQINCF